MTKITLISVLTIWQVLAKILFRTHTIWSKMLELAIQVLTFHVIIANLRLWLLSFLCLAAVMSINIRVGIVN